MPCIDLKANSRPNQDGQAGLGQLNPGQAVPLSSEQIIRRGQEAFRQPRRSYEHWMHIADAFREGVEECKRRAQTTVPKGSRYEREMGSWLHARDFHIDKGTRNRALECLEHRAKIDLRRATLTEKERFRYNHPDTVLKKWKKATVVPIRTRRRGCRQSLN